MGASHHPRSPTGASRTRRHHFLYIFLAIVVVAAYSARSVLYDTYTLLALPLFKWRQHASEFYLSAARDDFDITFAKYPLSQTGAGPGYTDKVPAILHHISLGSGLKSHEKWMRVRQDCLDLHPGWEAHLWTDETATRLVEERFPELKEMWEAGYKFPIQRIDALRYMVLYHYGGVILDMDLQCKRGLGPLRRFQFVAPAAVPTGFSIGFMMAEKGNKFVGELVGNLRRYNRGWLGLPYPTVMFSTGCHYASTIHAFMSRQDRKELKILAGTRENPRMHSLNGPVSTPLFNHLGSSSWHSYDAAMIVTIGKSGGLKVPLMFVAIVLLSFVVIRRVKRRRLGGGGSVGVSSPRLKVTC